MLWYCARGDNVILITQTACRHTHPLPAILYLSLSGVNASVKLHAANRTRLKAIKDVIKCLLRRRMLMFLAQWMLRVPHDVYIHN
jgi:hypothetical protein